MPTHPQIDVPGEPGIKTNHLTPPHPDNVCIADYVLGRLTKKERDLNNHTKWDRLDDEAQADICSDPRMAMVAQVNPYNAVPQLAKERELLDFGDRKVRFLDRIYTLKRTFVFKHNEETSNLTETTFDEIMAEYNYLKTCDDEFNNEDERKQYLKVIKRWLKQIITIHKTWLKFEEDLEMLKKMAVEHQQRELNPELFEELLGTPWAQFLDEAAPGWTMDWANGLDVVEKQRIPNSAVRIVEDWERETENVYRDHDESRGDGIYHFKSGIQEAQQTKIISKDGKFSRTSTLGIAAGTPFGKFPGGLEHYEGDLFPANQMISRMEGHRPANDWKAVTVQIKRLAQDEDGEKDPAQ